jgi:hypothetical protein
VWIISYDFGATWKKASISNPVNSYAWQRWELGFEVACAGYYEIWARATDMTGPMQPMVVPGWNPKGYLNNAVHRIAVQSCLRKDQGMMKKSKHSFGTTFVTLFCGGVLGWGTGMGILDLYVYAKDKPAFIQSLGTSI